MKKGFCVVIITIALLVITVPVYGSQTEFFEDGFTRLTFPDGWSIASADHIPHGIADRIGLSEEEIQSTFEPYYSAHTFYAVKRIDGQDTMLKLFYNISDITQGVPEPTFYWENPSFIPQAPETLNSDHGPFKKTVVSLKSEDQTVQRIVYYQKVKQTDITFLLQTKNGKLTKKQITEADAIVKTFYDRRYSIPGSNDTSYDMPTFQRPVNITPGDRREIQKVLLIILVLSIIYASRSLIKYFLHKKGYRTVIGSELRAVINYPSDYTFGRLLSAIIPDYKFVMKKSNPDTGFLRFKGKRVHLVKQY